MVDVHYASALVLFVASAVGCLLPFQTLVDIAPVRPLSTGIVFAVALCHLLPDAGEILDSGGVTDWIMDKTGLDGAVGEDGLYEVLPVAETLMCLGVFIMLVIDQCIPCPHHQVPSLTESDCPHHPVPTLAESEAKLVPSAANGDADGRDAPLTYHQVPNLKESDAPSNDAEKAKLVPSAENGDADGCDNHHTYGSTSDHTHDGRPSPRLANAKVYATELAIALHSVIIGFTMGVDHNVDTLVELTVAMVFHQVFEGVALSMIALQGDLGFGALCAMVVMFASSLPLGIMVGLGTYRAAAGDGEEDGEGSLDPKEIFFQGVPNAIAAGMLLHIGFELMMEDFNHNTGKFPAGKLVLVFVGGAAVCFLAVWA